MYSAGEATREVSGDEPETDPGATTRQRVARSILEHGPSTAAELATRLGLTAAGVRRHLDGLAEQGLLTSREQRVYGARGRGRPARVFVLTDAGRDSFSAGYDDLAVQALEFLAATAGAGAVGRFAEARVAPLEEHFRQALAGADATETPTQTLARTLSAEGYAASLRPAVAGEQLCQHHCPVAHVAERFPELCDAETEAFSRQLGVHVQRLATIAHGDGVCTTHIPRTTSTTPTSHGSAGTSGRDPGLNLMHAPDHEEHT
ncbi:helix-turn-helix transcriptional regulator [Microlunatus antarcticus]|uniref:Putative ArsR family transcriptional regulator n=1 Tax=Microlunatus antarcticus TaxID=53388 RepID=A0A7W5P830_9ACTN|nr:putative ArsR family transcriptional regulator [Microlunatus antarcticus]